MIKRFDMGSFDGEVDIESELRRKQKQYLEESRNYRILYFLLRMIAGLSAAMLPFVVATNTSLASGLSIAIVVTTVIDLIFNPKDRWKLGSESSALLFVARLKIQGQYEKYKESVDAIVKAESAKLERLVDMKPFLDAVQRTQNPANADDIEPLE